MDVKINLNDIIKKMNEDFPEDSLTELEKARYLYIELGKLLKFDINYISVSDIKTDDAYWKAVDFDNITENEYTCRQISGIYAELLKRAGIKAEAKNKPKTKEQLRYDQDPSYHQYTVVSLKDGREFIADLVDDLVHIQMGLETKHFGDDLEVNLPNVLTLDKEEVKRIDEKIGYSYPKDVSKSYYVYVNDFIQMLKDDMQNDEHLRDYISVVFSEKEANSFKRGSLIKYKFDIISRFLDTRKLGAREGKMFFDELFEEFFTEEEREEIKAYTLITEHMDENKIGKTDLVKCYVWKKSDNEFEYYLYEEGMNLRNIKKEELQEFLKREGYDYKIDKILGVSAEDNER